jgi:hypothetical protein
MTSVVNKHGHLIACFGPRQLTRRSHRYPFQVIHSRRFMRSGTVVGSFKIDLKTVYDAAGIMTLSITF